MDRSWKRAKAILLMMAKEDPNGFLQRAYQAAADIGQEDVLDIRYLVQIARRAPGYDKDKDPFRREGLM